MSQNAIHRGRQAHIVGDYVQPQVGWCGVILDYGDGLTFGVYFEDERLVIDPTDEAWLDAMPLLRRLPGPFVELDDGTMAMYPLCRASG